MTFELTSPVFAAGERIPAKYTCDGENIHPPLQWSDPPPGAKSFALVMDDPDAPAGTWVHWVLFNLPAETRELPERTHLPHGCQEGYNSWKKRGYGGPCPPSGTHRYFFKLYALDSRLRLPPHPDEAQLFRTIKDHVLAETELMGVYWRK